MKSGLFDDAPAYLGQCLPNDRKVYGVILFDANQIFDSATKNANFMQFETLRRALTEPNILWLPTHPENHFDSNQICFYSKLGKVFSLAEFQAKLFLTRK